MRLILPSTRKKKESPENKNWQSHADNYNINNSYLNQYYYPQYSSNSSTYVWNYDYNYLNHSQNIVQVDVILFVHNFSGHTKCALINQTEFYPFLFYQMVLYSVFCFPWCLINLFLKSQGEEMEDDDLECMFLFAYWTCYLTLFYLFLYLFYSVIPQKQHSF